MSIIIFIIILLVLVLFHEFGHFIAAKKSGVKVEEFGFGFPPRLFGIKIGETLYSINLLPIGGFVKLYGEEYSELERKKLSPELKNRTFVYKKPWQKTLIIVMGVVMNFILGWTLMSYLFTQGVPMPTNIAVGQVQINTPAAKAGIKEKDKIIRLIKDNKTYDVKLPTDIQSLAKRFGDQKVTLVIERNNKQINVSVIPRKNPPIGQGPLGIALTTSFKIVKYPWYTAPFYGLRDAASITKQIVSELFRIIFQFATLQKPKVDVTGPVGIAQYTGEAAKQGINAVLQLTALLSLNLAVINILPFPALDGGRLVFIIYEWITKKRTNQTLERNLNLAGIILLLTLVAIITINDIIRIYR